MEYGNLNNIKTRIYIIGGLSRKSCFCDEAIVNLNDYLMIYIIYFNDKTIRKENIHDSPTG